MIDRRNDPVLDIDFLKVKLPELVEEFCYTYKIDDMKSESENVFQGMLQYIASCVFDIRYKDGVKGSILLYDDDILTWVHEWFTMIARIYNKTCNPYNFSIVAGIEIDNIYAWYKNDIENVLDISITNYSMDYIYNNKDNIYSQNVEQGYKVTKKRNLIAKRLYKSYEESLASLLTSGKNPVGTIAILNRRYGWSNAEMSISAKPKTISASDLPLLSPPE